MAQEGGSLIFISYSPWLLRVSSVMSAHWWTLAETKCPLPETHLFPRILCLWFSTLVTSGTLTCLAICYTKESVAILFFLATFLSTQVGPSSIVITNLPTRMIGFFFSLLGPLAGVGCCCMTVRHFFLVPTYFPIHLWTKPDVFCLSLSWGKSLSWAVGEASV